MGYGSRDIFKHGKRRNKGGVEQRFRCKRCGNTFVEKYEAFENMKNDPKVVTLALDLYSKGISLRKISDHIKQFYEVSISHMGIQKWIKKYTKIITRYLDSLIPQLGGFWHTDEMKVKAKGEWVWLWNVMDEETRFMLASLISKKREIKDARRAFQEAKKNAQRDDPHVMVTDGLSAYIKAFTKEFFTLKKPRVEHVRMPRFTNPKNNNIVERLQGAIREREKVMRGMKEDLKAQETADGFRAYYNFIRTHQSLEGKTPAEEEGGINLNLEGNRWLSLIIKAIQETKT